MKPLKEEHVEVTAAGREARDSVGESAARRTGRFATAVALRRQTPEEQRQWEAAFDVFLAELVRQQLGRD